MKKILFAIIVLLFPFLIFAEDLCKEEDIIIESIELKEENGNAKALSYSKNNNNTLNLNTKMNVIGDSITYKVLIKNTSSSDYSFDKNQITTDYLIYDVSYEDNSSIIKAGTTKSIYLTVQYNNKPKEEILSNGTTNRTNDISFNLINQPQPITEEIMKSIKNPETKDIIFVCFIVLLISLVIILLIKKNNKKKYIITVISLLIILPSLTRAICSCSLNINMNYEIDAKEAIFLPGKQVNEKIKILAGTDTQTTTPPYLTPDTNINSIITSEEMPSADNREDKNIVSIPESPYPIYMWFDNGTIYWWSEDKTPALNEDASYMFCRLNNLNDISGVETFDVVGSKDISYVFAKSIITTADSLKKWNTSNVTDMGALLAYNPYLVDISALKNFDTSKVTQLHAVFSSCSSLENIDALKNWDVSKVENLNQIFMEASSLSSLKALKNWNTSSLKYIIGTFSKNDSLTTLEGLENWDVSKVINMNGAFSRDHNLENIEAIRNWNTQNAKVILGLFYETSITSTDPIKDWDTSNVVEMWSLFQGDTKLVDVDLKNWNTSKVTDMNSVFSDCSSIINLDLSTWDTSNVENMSYMFNGLTNLEVLNISSFDTNKVTSFKRMFNNSTKLKNIFVGENWNTNANIDETSYVFPKTSELPNFSNTNPNYRDLSYAHPNDGGYLTLK